VQYTNVLIIINTKHAICYN